MMLKPRPMRVMAIGCFSCSFRLESSMARPLEITAGARRGGWDQRSAGRLAALRADA
jgi:hypothetical protein